MKKLFRELRRREVFRTAGLYVGVAWIAIEVASVLLPTFDMPEEVLRWLIIVAIVGFPVVLVLAWIFDVSEHGIVVQDAASDTTVIPVGGRKMDFVVIGVLTVALIISVYLNFAGGPAVPIQRDPLTILIADFENQTGNELFDGSLVQALAIGIEGAPFINSYNRDQALAAARELELGDDLNEETARLVSVRQNVSLVLAGSIVPEGKRLQLELRAIDPATGEARASAKSRASDATEVLTAINEVTADIRKDLGDEAANVVALTAGETLTTNSLAALKEYGEAQQLARDGRDDEAVVHYQLAVELDPQFARAWSGWGLSSFKAGRSSEAEELWKKALSLQDRMTRRERFRTFGLYYTVVSLDYEKAIENYQQLVDEFPADGAGNNNLAILYTFTAQYAKALAQSEQLLKIYPQRTLYRANHAQYAVYAGNMDVAEDAASQVIKDDPEFFKSYMILAIVDLYNGEIAAAREHYMQMAGIGERGASLSKTGLADMALFERRYDDAITQLNAGIEQDRANNDERGLATKSVALAQAFLAQERGSDAVRLLQQLGESRRDGQLVPMAEIFVTEGLIDEAGEIAATYRQQLRPTAGVYANLIDGMIAYGKGDYTSAIGTYREALRNADLWIVRLYLARAYLAAGYAAEASAELAICIERRGEAGGLFFDDVPTWRYTATLNDWKAAADRELSGLATAVLPASATLRR